MCFVVGHFQIPLSAFFVEDKQKRFRVIQPEQVKKLVKIFSKVKLVEMASTFVAVTQPDVPTLGATSTFEENDGALDDMVKDRKKKFLKLVTGSKFVILEISSVWTMMCYSGIVNRMDFVFTGNHRFKAFKFLIDKGVLSWEDKVATRVYTRCSVDECLDLASSDNVALGGNLPNSFRDIIKNCRMIIMDTLMKSVEEKRSNWVLSVDQPLPKPSPKEATTIKDKFMKRFQNTTVSLF